MSEPQASAASGAPRRFRWKTAFDVSSTLVMLAAAVFLVWQNWPSSTASGAKTVRPPTEPVVIGGAPVKGTGAKVGLLVFSEFECPFCGAAARGPLKEIDASYVSKGRVFVTFKHFPLRIHSSAKGAAAAAICAGDQRKFWEMHDLLFANQKKLTDADLNQYGAQLGLEATRFQTCRNEDRTAEIVDADVAQGEALAVTGTPRFLFGRIQPDGRLKVTHVLSGMKPVKEFTDILDRLLATGSD